MLKARLITAALLIPSFLACLFFLPEPFWSLLMLFVCVIGLWEWAEMSQLSQWSRNLYVALTLTVLAGLVVVESAWVNTLYQQIKFYGILVSAVFWLAVSPVWLMFRAKCHAKLLLVLIGILLIVPTWLAMVSLRQGSPWLLLSVMATIWIADSAAYFAGKRFGRHKLYPEISPGKTWEGVVGACLAVLLYGLALYLFFNVDSWIFLGLLGLTVLSIMGDLFESMIKRQAGVKDSGRILPGHGGVLDRIDGLIPTLPLATFFVYFPIYYAVWSTHG